MFPNMVNAYDKKLFSDENYISDSCFNFRGKDPFKFIENIEKGMVQVLLHPLHFSDKGWGYDDIFFESFKRYLNSIQSNFQVNSKFREQVPKGYIRVIKEQLDNEKENN